MYKLYIYIYNSHDNITNKRTSMLGDKTFFNLFSTPREGAHYSHAMCTHTHRNTCMYDTRSNTCSMHISYLYIYIISVH